MGRYPVPRTMLPMASTTVLMGLRPLVLFLLASRAILLLATGTRFLAFNLLELLLACNLRRPSGLTGSAVDVSSSWARPGWDITAMLELFWSWPPCLELDVGESSRVPCCLIA